MTTEGYAGQEINKVTEVLEAATEREMRKKCHARCSEMSRICRSFCEGGIHDVMPGGYISPIFTELLSNAV